MVKGCFIVFEGIDGSGTTTQAKLLHNRLIAKGYQTMLTSEPTDGPVGLLIRQILTGRLRISNNKEIVDRELAFLFAADRHDHLYNESDGIMAKLEIGWIVISTRYFLSSLAYHVNNRSDREFVTELNSTFPNPDLTFYLNCPVHVALKRVRKARHMVDRYENSEKLSQVYANYEEILRDYKGTVSIVDATNTIENQIEHICETTMRMIKERIKE